MGRKGNTRDQTNKWTCRQASRMSILFMTTKKEYVFLFVDDTNVDFVGFFVIPTRRLDRWFPSNPLKLTKVPKVTSHQRPKRATARYCEWLQWSFVGWTTETASIPRMFRSSSPFARPSIHPSAAKDRTPNQAPSQKGMVPPTPGKGCEADHLFETKPMNRYLSRDNDVKHQCTILGRSHSCREWCATCDGRSDLHVHLTERRILPHPFQVVLDAISR